MATKELGPGGVEIWRSKGCMAKLWTPAPSVMCATFSGDVSEDLTPAYLSFLQQMVAQSQRLIVFADTSDMVNYETSFRVRTTQAHKQAGDRIEAVHVLVRSKLVALGMQTASLVIRNLIAHSSPEAFEAALARAVAERTRAR